MSLSDDFRTLADEADALEKRHENLTYALSVLTEKVRRDELYLRYSWQPVTPELPTGQWYVCRYGSEFGVWAYTSMKEWKDGSGKVMPVPTAIRWL